jgi:hypothetical protein
MLTAALLGIETFIAACIHDRFVRPYVGDILVVMLIYCFVRCFFPTGVRAMALYVFIFACAVEFLQYAGIIYWLGLDEYPVAQAIIGTSFDWRDILCYATGCLVCQFTLSSLSQRGNIRSTRRCR